MTTPAEELARLVIDTLDKQREYFRTRDTNTLRESKAMERRLREKANQVLHPDQAQPTLFGE